MDADLPRPDGGDDAPHGDLAFGLRPLDGFQFGGLGLRVGESVQLVVERLAIASSQRSRARGQALPGLQDAILLQGAQLRLGNANSAAHLRVRHQRSDRAERLAMRLRVEDGAAVRPRIVSRDDTGFGQQLT